MNKKVLIFDCGFCGAELEQRIRDALPVEVERITIKTKHNNTEVMSTRRDICDEVELYVGVADVIVITNPILASSILSELREKFPGQKFVGYDGDSSEAISGASELLILAPVSLRRTEAYQWIKAKYNGIDVVEPDCEKWIQATKYRNKLTSSSLLDEVKIGVRVLVLYEDLLLRRDRLKEIIGWRGEIINFEEDITKKVGKACGLTKWVA